MELKDLTIAIHGNSEATGGVYNMMGQGSASLIRAFQKNGVRAHYLFECIENKIDFHAALGYNASGYSTWNEILKLNIPNIVWHVDSIFYQNTQILNEFENNSNFFFFSLAECDEPAIKTYYPNLRRGYLPNAIDTDCWVEKKIKRDLDLVYFSAMTDVEKKEEELKNKYSKEIFTLMMMISDILLSTPTLPFFEVLQIFAKKYNLSFTKEDYATFFREIVYFTDYKRRIKFVQSIKNTKLTLFGPEIWKKYIGKNVDFRGIVDVKESAKVMNRAKITLHTQPLQLCRGLNERILNGAMMGSFVLASNAFPLEKEFEGNLGLYNPGTFENVDEQIEYFLKNKKERLEKVENTKKIILEKHTMEKRVRNIIELFRF